MFFVTVLFYDLSESGKKKKTKKLLSPRLKCKDNEHLSSCFILNVIN